MVYTIEEIKELSIPLLKKYNITKAGLFGSYANGNANENSDIDILLEFNESFELCKYNQFMEEIENKFHKHVDIIDYRFIWDVFKEDILRTEVKIL